MCSVLVNANSRVNEHIHSTAAAAVMPNGMIFTQGASATSASQDLGADDGAASTAPPSGAVVLDEGVDGDVLMSDLARLVFWSMGRTLGAVRSLWLKFWHIGQRRHQRGRLDLQSLGNAKKQFDRDVF